VFCLKFNGSAYQEVSCEMPDALIVVTRVELAQMSPFYLDPESAVEIASAILMIMAVAFVLRQVRKSLEN
jgi:hypothetical protein